jgi:integrase
MATIRERKNTAGDPVWNVQIRRKGYPAQSRTFLDHQAALDFAADSEREIRDRAVNPRAIASRTNVAGLVEAYLAEVKDSHKSYKDTAARCNYFAGKLGNVALTELTPDMIQGAVGQLDCSPATRNRYLGAFSGCISRMSKVTDKRPALFIGVNPCKLVERGTEPKGRQRVIKPKEFKKLLKYVDQQAVKGGYRAKQLPTFLRLSYELGRRRGELLGLTWDCIDYDDRVIHLLDTKTGDDQTAEMTKPVKKLLKAHEKEWRKPGFKYVFRGRQALAVTNYDDLIREAIRATFEPDFRGEMPVFHSIRHTVATELGDGESTEVEIMSVTGHKTSASVQRYVKKTRKAAQSAHAKRGRG